MSIHAPYNEKTAGLIDYNGLCLMKPTAFLINTGRGGIAVEADLARAIDEGARCRGYHYWGVIDCWSWNNAYKNRYGFVEVSLQDNYERRLKESANWLRTVATTHVIA